MAFTGLNTVRLRMILKSFLQQHSGENNEQVSLPTPGQVAQTESLLFLPSRQVLPIEYGVSFNHAAHKIGHEEIALRSILQNEKRPYWIFVSTRHEKPTNIMVVLKKGISPVDQAKSYFHATLLAHELCMLLKQDSVAVGDVQKTQELVDRGIEAQWSKCANECLKAGWDLTKTELQTHGYHIEIQMANKS